MPTQSKKKELPPIVYRERDDENKHISKAEFVAKRRLEKEMKAKKSDLEAQYKREWEAQKNAMAHPTRPPAATPDPEELAKKRAELEKAEAALAAANAVKAAKIATEAAEKTTAVAEEAAKKAAAKKAAAKKAAAKKASTKEKEMAEAAAAKAAADKAAREAEK